MKTFEKNCNNVYKNKVLNIYLYFSIWVINSLHEDIIIQVTIIIQTIILIQEIIPRVITEQ